MSLGSRSLRVLLGSLGSVVGPVVGLAVLLSLATPVAAAAPSPTTLVLAATPAHAGEDSSLQLDLVDADGAPVADALVDVERREAGAWTELATVATDAYGRAVLTATLRRDAADNVFRATYAGDAAHQPSATGPVAAELLRRRSRLVVGGPDTVVDEQPTTVRVRWRTLGGEPVPGRVRLFRADRGGDWTLVRTLRTNERGVARLVVTPRVDTRWRAKARPRDWVHGDTSPVHRVDNLPPGRPVRLPASAPQPRIDLPRQASATGRGANLGIGRIPGRVWAAMTGRSWHAGCPVGRTRLRLVRVNYWGYDGYRYRGEVVAHADAARQIGGALAEMYRGDFPIRAMYRVDRFGWSTRLRGGDDYASMNAGNTSGFNCRDVVGRPGVRSPHSYGRSLDINTWENPYRSARGLVPNAYWQPRSHPRVAWRSSSHPVVRIMARHGLRWTYGNGDTQHFDADAPGRVAVPRPCGLGCT